MTQPMLAVSKILVADNVRDPGWEKNIAELKASIKAAGVQQPPGVKPLDKPGPNGETHELIFGHRRLIACKELGMTRVPVVLLPRGISKKDALLRQLAENTGRANLTPLEEAAVFRRLIDEYGMSAKDIAQQWGYTEGAVSQRLALIKAPEAVRTAVEEGRITPTHARELVRVTDPKAQARLLKQVEKEHMPIPELKQRITELAPDMKRNDARGRPTKQEQEERTQERAQAKGAGKAEKTEKTTKLAKAGKPDKGGKVAKGTAVPTVTPRSVSEAKRALAELDKLYKEAQANGPKTRVEYYKGMMRGVGWQAGMFKDLISVAPAAEKKA